MEARESSVPSLWEELPPVRLYKIGGCYFVEDGNHGVSVARYQGVEWIDAEVIEFFPGLSANSGPDEEEYMVSGPYTRT